MSKKAYWTTALLILVLLVTVTLNLDKIKISVNQASEKKNEPIYQCQQTKTAIYNSNGLLNYEIVANKIDYSFKERNTLFTLLFIRILNEEQISSWIIKADKGNLDKNRILYLCGNVQLDSKINDFQIKRILTDEAVINLVTQDFFSSNKVTLYGPGFESTGMQMYANFRNKTATLIEKVHTSYEIQNS
ncbi:hypothetical protein A35E_00199 [secondary endosymbiont of Heteropsylla cubana]|uniref:Lipopolysaccharide export system protein LptC n=1 Tax=secondary endosymbiont of Heteropsylla cubana TaxID=134287 RepID=J3TYM7_9ENTR|nr:LPS export ABC transporter periplasmic protein LptC [secondary endosymbiont of Heteropsylla cubana]AFP85510.1 hypothetical protein A35E_00199 [secondary endosymbiont of Heteropsylla cubana]